MLEIIKKLCKEAGISMDKLEKDLKFGTRSIYSWNTSVPSVTKVLAVAQYFNVSLDYIMGRDFHEAAVSPKEKELLDAYRAMNEQGQTALLSAADYLVNKGIYKKYDLVSENTVNG